MLCKSGEEHVSENPNYPCPSNTLLLESTFKRSFPRKKRSKTYFTWQVNQYKQCLNSSPWLCPALQKITKNNTFTIPDFRERLTVAEMADSADSAFGILVEVGTTLCLNVWLSYCLTVCLTVWLSYCLTVCLTVWLSHSVSVTDLASDLAWIDGGFIFIYSGLMVKHCPTVYLCNCVTGQLSNCLTFK